MTEHPQEGILCPSFPKFQEDVGQCSAQSSQPVESNTSFNDSDHARKNNTSFNSISSFGYMNSGPLRVVNTNVAPSSTTPTLVSSGPGSSDESSDKASTLSGVGTTDTSSTSKTVTDTTRREAHGFKGWMRNIRHNNSRPKGTLTVRQERWSLDDFDEVESTKPLDQKVKGHRKSSSWSSNGFVGAVKSATASLISLSVPSQSRKSRRMVVATNGNRSANRGSQLATPENRSSVDSNNGSAQVIDDAAWERALQRRRTLEELISSEESYIRDLKILAYLTLIASASSGSLQISLQTQQNITEILHLHEDILQQIRRVVPESEIKSDDEVAGHSRLIRHIHRSSIGSLEPVNSMPNADRRSVETITFSRPQNVVLRSDPREVIEVAKIFDRSMGSFFIYEEYGAKYESMMLEMTAASKAIPNWHIYERGIEALANSLFSTSSQAVQSRKGLAFEDLLIKPIQRICKYPLLFADLHRHTPIIDSPDSCVELERVQYRLKERVNEINRATNNHNTRAKIRRSWHLHNLLVIPKTPSAPVSLRFLGHAILCGVLFVAYQSGGDVQGEYMLCVLFKSYILLATSIPGSTKFTIVAIISLKDTQVEASDNGRGLQCYTAPYSWKLVFGSRQKLYELIFCACSAREEEQWKSSLSEHSASEDLVQSEAGSTLLVPIVILNLKIRPLGYVNVPPGTLIPRFSIQRAATVGSKSNMCQVIITNTNAVKDHCNKDSSVTYSISRSQSLLAGDRVLILTPKRVDRIRMEYILTDVWTRDLLPYPGMSPNRSEHLIRTSAGSMMRKLSRASRSSSLKKRSGNQIIAEPDQNVFHHVTNEASVIEDKHERPAAYFQSYWSHFSRSSDENVQNSPLVGSSSRKSSLRKIGRWKPKIDENHQFPELVANMEENETPTLGYSGGTSGRRSDSRKLLKGFSSDVIRSWLT